MFLIEDLGMVYPNKESKQKRHLYLVKCPECFKIFRVRKYEDKKKCRSCSFKKGVSHLDLPHLIKLLDENNDSGKKQGVFICSICNNEFISDVYSQDKSIKKTCKKCAHKTHSMSYNRLYKIWAGEKYRCEKLEYYENIKFDNFFDNFDNWKEYVESLDNYNVVGYDSIDRIDNNDGYKVGNLRWATRSTQLFNRRIPKDNTSGYKGVGWNKRKNKWFATISFNKKTTFLGLFSDKEDAIKARLKAEKELLEDLI